jgi:hypothetical protein
MTQTDLFPLSWRTTKRALILFAVYGLLVIVAALYYALASGDRSFPAHYVMLILVAGVCSWGLRARYRWAWLAAILFAGWQIYYGVSSTVLFLGAGGANAPAPAKAIVGLLAIRTVILAALFVLLVLFADREKAFGV